MLNRKVKGFTLVEVMIVVAIIALLAAIAIPNLLRARLTAGEANAQGTLRTISTACETYAASMQGVYPANEALLTGAAPPYLNRAYNGVTIQGYVIAEVLAANGYTVTATPATCGSTGNTTYTIATGGVLTSVACN